MPLTRRSSEESMGSAAPSLAYSVDSISDTERGQLEHAEGPHQLYMLPSRSRTPSPAPTNVAGFLQSLAASSSSSSSPDDSDAASNVQTNGDHPNGGIELHTSDEVAQSGTWIPAPRNGPREIRADRIADDFRRPDLPHLLAQVTAWVAETSNDTDKDIADEVLDLPDATDLLAGVGAHFDGIVLDPAVLSPKIQ